MYAKSVFGVPKQRALGALAAAMLLALAAFVFLSNALERGAAEEKSAAERLANDSAVIERYSARVASSAQPSADAVEARANEFLMSVLGGNGISDRSIDYDQAETLADGRQTLKINVQCNRAQLASVLGFMRDVEKGRRNLVLVSADISRNSTRQDVWTAHFVYGAVITTQARSRT